MLATSKSQNNDITKSFGLEHRDELLERQFPAIAPEENGYFSICYRTLAAYLGGERLALLLQWMHYWLSNEHSGYLLKDGTKWIYNGYKEIQEQFPWLSIDQIGASIRQLEQLGWLISDRFHNLNRNPGFATKAPHFHEDNQRKWYRINYQKIFEDTGFDLLFGGVPSSTPPKRRKHPRGANREKSRLQSVIIQNAICNNPDSSIYKENQINSTTNNAAVDEKEFLDTEQLLSLSDVVKEADVKLNVSDLVAEEPEESIQGQPNPGEDQYSPAPRDVSQVETTSGVDDLKSVSNDVLGEVEKLVGDEYSPQLERLVLNSQTEIVKNALAFVKEKLAKGTEIRQKAGYLTNAIKSKLKPSFPLQPPRGASSQERQYPPGFLEWYELASEKGWVDGRELEDLGWINGRGPIVFVPSLGRAMPWYDAQEAWVDGHPCGEPMEKRT